jgi:perosamine synthetase
MTNLNAAVGLGQMFHLKKILSYKKRIHNKYNSFFKNNFFFKLLKSSLNCKSNYWINAIYIENININERDFLLSNLNKKLIECRPLWKLIHTLPMYKNCQKSSLNNSIELEKKIICLPSSPIYGKL